MLVEPITPPPVLNQPKNTGLSRRDWIILPLLSLLTVIVLGSVTELVTRIVWPAQETDACFVDDPVEGYRYKPNCVSRIKNAEGVWTTNEYNDCGFRSPSSCRSRAPGTFRLVILGSSAAQGMFIPYADTFGARAAVQLQTTSGRKVEVQNLGVPNASPLYVYRRLGQALALRPDAVLLAVTPFDLEQRIDPEALAERNDPQWRVQRPAAHADPGLYKRVQHALTESRAALMAQHFLFENRERFLRFYLVYGDKADFLRQPFSEAWQKRFDDLDVIVGDISERLAAAHTPFFLMAIPSRAEAALLSDRDRPAGTDPFAFGQRIGKIAAAHGATYIDLMVDFSRIAHSETLFYVVDGHITPEGQTVIARKVAGSIPVVSR